MKRRSPFRAESFRQSDAYLTAYLRGGQTVVGSNQGWDRHGQQLSYLKLRDLEFPGYGCCYLTEHNDDVAAALDVGREVLTYHSLEEAAECWRNTRGQPASINWARRCEGEKCPLTSRV